MRKYILQLIFLLLPMGVLAQAVGQWKAFLGYDKVEKIELADDGLVFCLSQGNLFCYDETDQSVTTLTKMNYLNDSNISHIAWVKAAKRLIVVYSNGNIDLVDSRFNVFNMSAYGQHVSAMNKRVKSVYVDGEMVYMSTAFGVVKVDAAKAYVVETCNFSANTYSTVVKEGAVYAATERGLLRGNMTDNLIDPNNWKTVLSGAFAYAAKAGDDIVLINNSGLIVHFNEKNNGTSTCSFRTPFKRVNMNDGVLMLYGSDKGYIVRSKSQCTVIDKPVSAMNLKGSDLYCGLDDKLMIMTCDVESGRTEEKMSGVRPDGPHLAAAGFLRYENGKLLVSNGFSTKGRGAEVKYGDEWTPLEIDLQPFRPTTCVYIYNIKEDPLQPNHYMAATVSGLFEFSDNKLINVYGLDNSPLKTVEELKKDDPNYVIVCGLEYGSDGKLWLFNGGTTESSLYSFQNGIFTSYNNSNFMKEGGTSMQYVNSMMFDSRGLLWMANSHFQEPSLMCFDPATDTSKKIKTFINQDGTKVEVWHCRSLAEDKEGNIWVGTELGPLMLTAESIERGDDVFQQVKVPRNDGTNLADYLLSGEDVTSIYIDKANRKWFGTSGSGIYVISPDNIVELDHITSLNSNLLSNYVEALAYDEVTGELYVGTSAGLCSYQTDLSAMTAEGEMTADKAWAYPNPVTPDYNGLVTICGLEYDADVKIVTSSGTLVHSGRSKGGTYEWDCCDRQGRRVASGVYMVVTATPLGGKGMVCKIAVVN